MVFLFPFSFFPTCKCFKCLCFLCTWTNVFFGVVLELGIWPANSYGSSTWHNKLLMKLAMLICTHEHAYHVLGSSSSYAHCLASQTCMHLDLFKCSIRAKCKRYSERAKAKSLRLKLPMTKLACDEGEKECKKTMSRSSKWKRLTYSYLFRNSWESL